MRVIASVYTGSTEKRAIDDLVGLGAKVKISYDTTPDAPARQGLAVRASYRLRHRLCRVVEPDAIGACRWARVECPAHVDGQPRHRRADPPDLRPVLERARVRALRPAASTASGSRKPSPRRHAAVTTPIAVTAIELGRARSRSRSECSRALQAERQRGHFKNLVVAPTGTGKTWVSAFDYQRLATRRLRAAALRCPPRRDPASRAQDVFRASPRRPSVWRASCRQRTARRTGRTCSHRSSRCIDRSTRSTRPVRRRHRRRVPPRRGRHVSEAPRSPQAQGAPRPDCDAGAGGRQDILHWFDDRIAYEMRLWEALDQRLLCPFHYLGVGDGTDLRGVRVRARAIRHARP